MADGQRVAERSPRILEAPPPSPVAQKLMAGFSFRRVRTSGAEIQVAVAGDGPPLLLLHGNPLTLVSWHKVAPALARHFTVVAADLRGYGDSSKPEGGPDHAAYSFRAMGEDSFEVMSFSGKGAFWAMKVQW
jgi:haloacetate dehalogenase